MCGYVVRERVWIGWKDARLPPVTPSAHPPGKNIKQPPAMEKMTITNFVTGDIVRSICVMDTREFGIRHIT